MQTIL
jgi:hypothetical protein